VPQHDTVRIVWSLCNRYVAGPILWSVLLSVAEASGATVALAAVVSCILRDSTEIRKTSGAMADLVGARGRGGLFDHCVYLAGQPASSNLYFLTTPL